MRVDGLVQALVKVAGAALHLHQRGHGVDADAVRKPALRFAAVQQFVKAGGCGGRGGGIFAVEQQRHGAVKQALV